VTWVYPGAVQTSEEPCCGLNEPNPLNIQLLAAHGYVVLVPSMPSPSGAQDPYFSLMNGVMPAIDRAIEMGVADPERVAVMGHSFGGFGTYGLITQTDRFKAAVALAGASDFVSGYGTVIPSVPWDDPRNENERMRFYSSGQVGLAAPLWENPWRYIRSSPVFYADRVHTPILIIQGDMDYVPIQQGEEFFMSLYSQGKRAEFVRYWGEGHVFESPANITDMWRRIYSWLDQYIGVGQPAGIQ
jgi:dipeptidyl aminopeptidase/acylaminoacyl peptidase